MPTSVKQLMEAANAVVPKVTPAQAQEIRFPGNVTVPVNYNTGTPRCDLG